MSIQRIYSARRIDTGETVYGKLRVHKCTYFIYECGTYGNEVHEVEADSLSCLKWGIWCSRARTPMLDRDCGWWTPGGTLKLFAKRNEAISAASRMNRLVSGMKVKYRVRRWNGMLKRFSRLIRGD